MNRTLALLLAALALVMFVALSSCNGDKESTRACDAEPEILTTSSGVEFVRTPDSCFEGLPNWSYEPHYVEIDGLRQAYVDEGPMDGEVILLLHGQPSWSYLYRKMIPILVDGGFRVIAMDHLGMGRSDKPTDIESYTYLGHNDRLERFIQELELADVTLFVQDWGSTIGLRVAGLHPEWFARIVAADGDLPQIPSGFTAFPPVHDPNTPEDLPSPFAQAPAQQVVGYDGCLPLFEVEPGFFGVWIEYALKGASFRASEVVEAITWYDLPDAVEAAYDAPFPSRVYMAGPRVFPSLVNEMGGTTDEAWASLRSFTRPFLTIWAANDTGSLGLCETQDKFICEVPGATGQAHARLAEASHFLQDDQGEEIARRLVAFMRQDSSIEGNYQHDCDDSSGQTGAGGLGESCESDADCAGLDADLCLGSPGQGGFCTIEGCESGTCDAPFVCCYGCNEMAAPMLPFEGSVCVPEQVSSQLSNSAGCTCD
jgi:pimeloyl-ACP methyl ester carboxylesterase